MIFAFTLEWAVIFIYYRIYVFILQKRNFIAAIHTTLWKSGKCWNFDAKSLRKSGKVLKIWIWINFFGGNHDNIFTPLNLNHNHNTCAAIKHLLDMPHKQTCHGGPYSMVFTASKVWNDILRKSNKDLFYCEFSAFKKTIFQRFFSKYEKNNWNDWALFG